MLHQRDVRTRAVVLGLVFVRTVDVVVVVVVVLVVVLVLVLVREALPQAPVVGPERGRNPGTWCGVVWCGVVWHLEQFES